MQQRPHGQKWKRGAAAGAGLALLATLVATNAGPQLTGASSHREAPLIAGDPRADNTDVYAFVSPDDEDSVTLIANWIPFEEPNGGPNFYPWADGDGETSGASYKINIDNDGDAVADIVYEWLFTTVTKDPNQFLVNTGPFDSVLDPTLNVYQTYDLNVIDTNGTLDPADDTSNTVLDDAISAPSISGAVSTPQYQPLVDEAVASGTAGDLKSFAGQADDPFFLDLRIFDLLYGANAVPEVGEDTLAGYNVNTIALQVPKAELALNGNDADNPVIGVWSTTDRIVQTEGGSTPADDTDDEYNRVQVSRLGNPLVNEVVLPLALKDAFNSIPPSADATIPAAVSAVRFPILPPLVELIYGQPVPGDTNGTPLNTADDAPRSDLVEIFLQGISTGNFGLGLDGENATTNPALNADLNSIDLNADVTGPVTPSEMLRLNMAVPVSASPSPAGVLGGDFQGFPNGRRLGDDVVDIALAVAEGAVFKEGADVSALAPFDSVDRNDRAFSNTFPYVALPHTDSVLRGSERTPRVPEVISANPERILDTRAESAVNYSGAKPTAGQVLEVKVAGVGTTLVPDDASAVYLNITSTNTEAVGFVTAYPCDTDRPTASSLNPFPGRTSAALAPSVMDSDGNVCVYTNSATDLIVDLGGYAPSTSGYSPIVPQRLIDTREGATPTAGSVTKIDVTGVGAAALPDSTKAVAVSVTSDRSQAIGFLTVYSCDDDAPLASNLNTFVGEARANLAITAIADDGTICVFSNQATDIIVDLVGAYAASSTYTPTTPMRLLDTRPGAEQVGYSGAKPIDGQTIELQVRGAGTAVPADAGTVVLNVTGTAEESDGFLTVYPCGEARPTASNTNLSGVDAAAAVIAEVGDNDRVCIFTSTSTHIVVDIAGHYPGTIIAK